MNQLERTLTSLEVAEMVGRNHADVLRDIRKIIEHLSTESNFAVSEYFIESSYKDSTGRTLNCYRLTKKGCELFGTRMTGAKGTQFAIAYIERFNEMEQVQKNLNLDTNDEIAFRMQLLGAKYASEMLRVDETSKIKMLEEVHKQHGVPTNHLPQYMDEEVTESLTSLLKKHGVKIATAKFNTKLIELGILEIKERPSSKGGVKEFKSLTERGLYYGKNLINPRNPKETQPHYYESKFSELIQMVIGEVA